MESFNIYLNHFYRGINQSVAEEKTVRIFGLAAVKLLLANPLRFWLSKIPNFDCRLQKDSNPNLDKKRNKSATLYSKTQQCSDKKIFNNFLLLNSQFLPLFFVKGIVSRDFEGLQMILMDRLCVPDVPLEVYSFLNLHLHTVF